MDIKPVGCYWMHKLGRRNRRAMPVCPQGVYHGANELFCETEPCDRE